MQEEPTFAADEPQFDEEGFGEESFSTEDTFGEGADFQDDTVSDFDESTISDAAESAQDTASSIFSTLWDLFTGGDD